MLFRSVTHCLLFIGSRYVTGKNTGFKNFNPRRPCRKCWYRHSRPYVGALVNRLWSINNHAPSSSNTGINFQRPLPAFHPHRQREQLSRAVTSRMPGPCRNLLQAISNPELHQSGSQSLQRHQHRTALPPAPPLLIQLALQHSTVSRSAPGIQLGGLRIGGKRIKIILFFHL